ncbi:unnamed protein product [Moneuplotes crassus]|uniref:Uncharacterized protein n=1 Tax=Euplotes crassus TaxID=5936 RepID=A0AAD2CZD1_EUPCR|nr:unnamed protein product [Moneuplotes crassus]
MSEKQQADPFFLKMILGGIACMTAGTVTHPVDLIKTRMQASYATGGASLQNSSISTLLGLIRKEGVGSLYKGLSATLLRESIYSSLRLGLYEPFKQLFGATDREHTPFYIMILSGASCGMVASAISNPADMIKIRMQACDQKPRQMRCHIKEIYSHNGIRGFYRGVEATMSRAVVVNATQLPAYDFTKHKLINHGIMEDNHLCHLVSSITAGVILTLVSGPFDLARTRMMNQPAKKIYNSMFDCLMKSIQRDGFISLYKGFTPQWMRFGPFTIVQLLVWEHLRRIFGMRTI